MVTFVHWLKKETFCHKMGPKLPSNASDIWSQKRHKKILKRPAFKIAISKIELWLGPRKQENIAHTASSRDPLTAEVTTMHDEAVHAIFLGYLEAYQIVILKIAFLSAGVFLDLTPLAILLFRSCGLTVGCEKLDPLFFLNNSLNIQHRTPKPPRMCFCVTFQFFFTFLHF